jgi:hypothetical protein
MYKQVLTPNKKNHSFEMPEQFYGKKVEVIVVEVTNTTTESNPVPPFAEKVAVTELFESFGKAPDFASVEEIRTKAWPSKW